MIILKSPRHPPAGLLACDRIPGRRWTVPEKSATVEEYN
jgi:hypothetical protein